jgi:hypothetical protein
MLMKGRMGRLPNNPWPSLQLMIPLPVPFMWRRKDSLIKKDGNI